MSDIKIKEVPFRNPAGFKTLDEYMEMDKSALVYELLDLKGKLTEQLKDMQRDIDNRKKLARTIAALLTIDTE